MPKLKGNILAARLAVIEKAFGEAGRRAVLDKMADADRKLLEGRILPGSWYENRVMVELMSAVDRELGRKDRDVVQLMGYYSAEIQLLGVYDSFVREGRPEHLLNRCPNIWQLTHDFGRVQVDLSEGGNRCRIRLEDIEEITVRGLMGWVQKGLEISGCQDVRCRLEPVPNCDLAFDAFWAWR